MRSPVTGIVTLILLFLVAIALGFVPLFYATRRQLQFDLQDGGRGSSGGQTRARNALIVAQLALTLVLLVGAGLLGRGPQHVVPLGYALPRPF